MTKLALNVFVIISFSLPSCQKKSTPKELIQRFNTNKVYFDSLVNALRNNSTLDTVFEIGADNGLPEIRKTYPIEFALLKKLGITDASSHRKMCRPCRSWYYLKTDWPNDYPIYLIYNFTDQAFEANENNNGFYKIDNYKNETWGLGENWKMFRWVAVIEDIKQ